MKLSALLREYRLNRMKANAMDCQPNCSAVYQRPDRLTNSPTTPAACGPPPRAERRQKLDFLDQDDIEDSSVSLQLGEDIQIDRIQAKFGLIWHSLRSEVMKIIYS